MTCEILEKLSDKEIFHTVEYTQEFNDLTDDQKENLSYGQDVQYIKDPVKEENFQTEIRTEKGNHFKICDDPNCKRLLNLWKSHEALREFVQ